MNKLLMFLSFTSLSVLLTGGLIAPSSPEMWLAGSSLSLTILRILMMVVLASLLLTKPPRAKLYRAVVMLFAIGLLSWSTSSTYQNKMQLLDSFSIMAASISMGISVLEFKKEEAAETANNLHYSNGQHLAGQY
ncbi:MAG: hypothetical protein NVS1B10_02040 [Candidatus Saccharimonadales bacterium]